MKILSNALLIGALAAGSSACEDDGDNCRPFKNVSGAPTLTNKGQVLDYCASTGEEVMSCMEAARGYDGAVQRDLMCSQADLSANLDVVFASEGAYCVPGGLTQYCDGSEPAAIDPVPASCEIVPDPEASWSLLENAQEVIDHCSSNPSGDQANLTCLGLTADGNEIITVETTCADPNLASKMSGFMQNAESYCLTTDNAEIRCDEEAGVPVGNESNDSEGTQGEGGTEDNKI